MRVNMRVALAATTLIFATGVAHAQRPHEHQGFWIGFGAGGGYNVAEGLDGERLAGGGGFVRLGGTPNQRILLGFELIGWARDREGSTISRGNASFVALFYPGVGGGLFVKGGLGGGGITRTTIEGNTTTSTSKGGSGATLGVGWDLRIGSNLYVTPNLDYLFQKFESEDDPVLGRIPGTNSILLLTIGLVWH